MNKQFSLAVLVSGVALFIYGISSFNSFGSDVARTFTGTPTDRTMWFLGGGAAMFFAGAYGLLASRGKE